ncbi:unnamed protein product, partial [Prorocentrum cordatum]
REAAGLVLLDRDEVIGSAAGPGERRLLQRRRKTTSTTADRGQSEDAAAAASHCPGRGRGRCCGRGVCHGQRLQQVPLPSEAGFPLHWQVQCAPGAPSPSGRTRPRLRYFSTEAASNRAAGSGRIVPPPPPP